MEIIKLSATESTNSFLKELMTSKKPNDFTVVTTDTQTKGRGQAKAVWESEPGKNLTFSVLKRYCGLRSGHYFLVSICVSLALFDVLEELGVSRLAVKWPNDILSGKSKICGILIENSIAGSEIKTSVIGIGLNVNQVLFTNNDKASSLKLLLNRELDLDKLLQTILNSLQRYLNAIDTLDLTQMLERYEKVLFKKGVTATFQEPGGPPFTGIIRGISKGGKLRIVLEDNAMREYGLKEIKLHY